MLHTRIARFDVIATVTLFDNLVLKLNVAIGAYTKKKVAEGMQGARHDILLVVLIYEEDGAGEEEAHVRVLEAVAAARAAEELLGEANVAAHGADRGCGGGVGGGGGGAGHGGQS